ncbi:hypothetical protein LDENG_00233760 [Lucifuga dentata]|nr:hypothetical protein LDENG_00233760 [Lucifuga dentata]
MENSRGQNKEETLFHSSVSSPSFNTPSSFQTSDRIVSDTSWMLIAWTQNPLAVFPPWNSYLQVCLLTVKNLFVVNSWRRKNPARCFNDTSSDQPECRGSIPDQNLVSDSAAFHAVQSSLATADRPSGTQAL